MISWMAILSRILCEEISRKCSERAVICIFQAVCQFFCEYLIILAQRGKNRDQVTNYFKNLEVRYATYISKVSPQIALRSLLAAYGTQIVSIIFSRRFNRNRHV